METYIYIDFIYNYNIYIYNDFIILYIIIYIYIQITLHMFVYYVNSFIYLIYQYLTLILHCMHVMAVWIRGSPWVVSLVAESGVDYQIRKMEAAPGSCGSYSDGFSRENLQENVQDGPPQICLLVYKPI